MTISGADCCTRLGFYCENPSFAPFMYGTLVFVILGVVGCISTAFILPRKDKL